MFFSSSFIHKSEIGLWFFFLVAAVMPSVQFALTINEFFYKLLHSCLYILLFFFPHMFLKPGIMLK